MGFSLDTFFDELFEILDSDAKAAVKVRKLYSCIKQAKQYAKECGRLKEQQGS